MNKVIFAIAIATMLMSASYSNAQSVGKLSPKVQNEKSANGSVGNAAAKTTNARASTMRQKAANTSTAVKEKPATAAAVKTDNTQKKTTKAKTAAGNNKAAKAASNVKRAN
jgi:hypothetical protein